MLAARMGRQFMLLGVVLTTGAVTVALLGVVPGLAVTALVVAAIAVWWPRGPVLPRRRRLRRALRTLETGRLLLRAARPDDVPGFVASIDAEVIEANGWTDEVVRSWVRAIERPRRRHRRRRTATLLLMVDKGSGAVVGAITVHLALAKARTCMVGWWTAAAWRRQGYGTEALGTLFDALHRSRVEVILVGTAPDNAGVRRVAEKLGATDLGESPHQLPNGTATPSVWFGHTATGVHPARLLS